MNRKLPTLVASACLALLLPACGSDDGGNNNTADASTSVDANNAGTTDAMVGGGNFTDLITGTWSKEPGSDDYWCSWVTVQEDTYITGFEAVSPQGTHHTVLSVTDSYNGPDKEEACSAGTLADQLLFASGVGTNSYPLPDGVAVKVSAGQTVMLNLHLFNASDITITGTSGTRISTTTEAEVQNLAEFFFAGTYLINIPGNGVDTTATGRCTVNADSTIFTLWPHMHTVGKHMKVDLDGTMLLDENYSFEDQKMYPITPVPVTAGQKINVECTWNNPQGNATKTFGDGSNDEMCFAGVYRYPATGVSAFCTGF